MSIQAGEQPCGLARRLLIMVYDGLIVISLLILAGALALPITGGGQQAFRDVFYTLYLVTVWFMYLGWCWTRIGQTLGMRAWKTKITGLGGAKITWKISLERFLISLLSAVAFGAGFWWAWLNPQRMCWHDRVSRTRLVRTDPRSD